MIDWICTVYITVDGQVLDNKIKQTEMRFVYEIISFLDVPYYIVYFVMSRHMVTSLLTRQADWKAHRQTSNIVPNIGFYIV